MTRTAVIRDTTSTVVNVVLTNGSWTAPAGHTARNLDDTEKHVSVGWRRLNNTWVEPDPNAPKTDEQIREGNRATLAERAAAALDANRTYLALTSPTNAQNLAQIRLLTRECTALIRLLLNRLDGTE